MKKYWNHLAQYILVLFANLTFEVCANDPVRDLLTIDHQVKKWIYLQRQTFENGFLISLLIAMIVWILPVPKTLKKRISVIALIVAFATWVAGNSWQ